MSSRSKRGGGPAEGGGSGPAGGPGGLRPPDPSPGPSHSGGPAGGGRPGAAGGPGGLHPPGSSDTTTLARAREALAAARGKRRLDLVLEQRDPAALVRALPADDLYFTIREIGLGDAAELVQLASAEQFRIFLDLACWAGDRPDPRRALAWIRAARADALEGPRQAARWRAKLKALDAELLALVLRSALRVHDLREDEDPHVESDRFLRTPDGQFLVEFEVEGAEYAAVRALLDDLMAESPFHAARLLSSVRWELPSELEESELRWRTGRLADLGYPSREEALSWFARPPRGAPAPPAGAPQRPPGFFLERLGQGSLLARAAARLPPDEREHLEGELVAAANAVLVADAVDPGDLDSVRQAVSAARALVDLGLEDAVGAGPAAAGAYDADAAEALARTAVKALFQRGFGRVLALKWRAERLLSPPGGGPRAPRLDPPLGDALEALARRRPLYAPALEAPRARWGTPAAASGEPRPFLSSAELARAAAALELCEGLAALSGTLGLSGAAEGDPTLAVRYLTALANERLGRAFAPAPLAAAELPAAARALEALDDARLTEAGEAGEALAALARGRAEELAPLREGDVSAAGITALIVKG